METPAATSFGARVGRTLSNYWLLLVIVVAMLGLGGSMLMHRHLETKRAVSGATGHFSQIPTGAFVSTYGYATTLPELVELIGNMDEQIFSYHHLRGDIATWVYDHTNDLPLYHNLKAAHNKKEVLALLSAQKA